MKNFIEDRLSPENVTSNLNTKIIGKNISYHDTIDSTNNVAKLLAKKGIADGTIVISEQQTGGKGRLNRSFFSPKFKSILLSIILRPKFNLNDAAKCTLMTAVAVSNAMIRFNLTPQIKWPNDILYDKRKVVGILTEMSSDVDKINYIVVGIGINVNINRDEFPDEIKNIAASLSEMKGEYISRVDFLKILLEEFEKLYLEANKNNFSNIFNQWRKFNITIGKKIRVIPAGQSNEFNAIAEDIDNEGALIVKTNRGIEKIYAGDVSIRE